MLVICHTKFGQCTDNSVTNYSRAHASNVYHYYRSAFTSSPLDINQLALYMPCNFHSMSWRLTGTGDEKKVMSL